MLTMLTLFACNSPDPGPEAVDNGTPSAVPTALKNETTSGQLGDYWYQGQAELSRYELSQNRYGDTHPGEVVMVFVTEDFLTDKQVKNEQYTNANSVPILKNNIIKTFPTGIYNYSVMTSVFTPVNAPGLPMTLKVSNSVQEWCGQTYMQINYDHKKRSYDYLLHSYFEKEADQSSQVKGTLLEEELFNRIRIDPGALPTGAMELLPSAEFIRLTHRPYLPTRVEASLADYSGKDFSGTQLVVYRIEYPEFNRSLEIVFEREAPYRISGWRDTYPSMFDQQARTTVAKRTHTVMDAYWSHNSLEDMEKRRELGLD